MKHAYEEPGYIKICGQINKRAMNYYHFICPACNSSLQLGTDGGRYGNIGDFACQTCGAEYYATDDDNNPNTPLHISKSGSKLFDLTIIHGSD